MSGRREPRVTKKKIRCWRGNRESLRNSEYEKGLTHGRFVTPGLPNHDHQHVPTAEPQADGM